MKTRSEALALLLCAVAWRVRSRPRRSRASNRLHFLSNRSRLQRLSTIERNRQAFRWSGRTRLLERGVYEILAGIGIANSLGVTKGGLV
jgi:hypothetical protein